MTTNTITRDELITEWVKALRSGDYKQGTGYLHDVETDTYCCLGVACDILAKRGLLHTEDRQIQHYKEFNATQAIYETRTVTFYQGDTDTESANGLLPESVANLLGLSEVVHGDTILLTDPRFRVTFEEHEYPETHEVSSLNDNFGFTFAQVADLIEEQLR